MTPRGLQSTAGCFCLLSAPLTDFADSPIVVAAVLPESQQRVRDRPLARGRLARHRPAGIAQTGCSRKARDGCGPVGIGLAVRTGRNAGGAQDAADDRGVDGLGKGEIGDGGGADADALVAGGVNAAVSPR